MNFERSPLPTSGAFLQHSFQDFRKLANIKINTSQLKDISTYKPSKIKYTADNGIDMENSVFGCTNWIDLRTFLPP